MRRAILFDIDGTLLHAKGIGRPAFAEAFRAAYGVGVDVAGVSFVGATDTGVVRDLARACGVASTPAREERFYIELAKRLEPRLAQTPPAVYPGARAFLEALRGRGFLLGVVTGNIRATAWAKLIHAGLADLFDFGAYAGDDTDRDALARLACRRARDLGAEPCLLVGDTPKDIQAAHAAGLPCLAVSVAGWKTPRELADAEGLLPGYGDLPAALRAVEALAPAPLPIRVLAWELTRRCPMACRHCRGAARDAACAGELSAEACGRVLETLAAAYPGGGKPLLILTGGEPMYRDDLEDIVRRATALGFPCVLAPCGRFATAGRLRALKAAGVRALSISLDGPDAAAHDAFRGVPGAFDMALRAMAAAREAGLPFQLNHTVTRATLGTLRAMRDLALAQGATRIDYFFLVPVGRGAAIAGQCLDDAQTEAALDEILDLDAEGALPVHVTCEPRVLARARARGAAPRSRLNGCMAGAGFCFLAHDGRLQPCGFYEADGGNVRDFGYDLPAAYRASALFARLRGGGCCLARAAAR